MNSLPLRWKLFKIVCILQMIFVALELMLSIAGLFYGRALLLRTIETICYGLVLSFLYNGYALLNDNYPATPLTPPQKRSFNLLFLLNFLLIAFLFSEVVNEWRQVAPYFSMTNSDSPGFLFFQISLMISLIIFIFHFVFLIGMYRLRRVIFLNASKQLDQDFI